MHIWHWIICSRELFSSLLFSSKWFEFSSNPKPSVNAGLFMIGERSMTMHNPAHPGEILKELVIEPMELTVTDVAKHLDVSRKTLSKILNGRGAITPEMAVRL